MRRTPANPGCLLLVLLAATLTPVLAESASVTVGARNVHYAKIEAATNVGAIVITQSDVTRGFVQLSDALTIGVRTNSRTGYRIGFAFAGSFATAVRLSTEGTPGIVTPAQPYLSRTSDGPTRETLVFHARIDLADGTQPGAYFWPLDLVSITVGGDMLN